MLNKPIFPAQDPNTAAESASTLLDPVAIGKLHALDPHGRAGIVQRVLRTYEGSLNKLLLQFDTARAGNDVEGLRHVAHTLRSSSAAVGAMQLAARCAEVEAMVRERSIEQLPAALDAMHSECRRAGQAVRAMLDSMGPAA